MSSDALNRKFIYIPTPALVVSIGLHLLLPVLFLLAGVVANLPLFHRHETPDLYQNFIQVDMVDLPDETTPEKVDMSAPVAEHNQKLTQPEPALPEEKVMKLPEPAPAESKKPEPKKPELKKEARNEVALKKEREQALKKLQADAKREAALNALLAAQAAKAGRSKIKGNILSQGTSSTGKLGNAKDRYKALVTARIKEHFNIYAWQKKKKGLVEVVTIELFPTGRVREKRVEKAATDSLFHSAVMAAIDEAQPLPVPEDLSLLNGGITIEFRPEE